MKSRVLVPELMDDPAIDPVEHRRALDGLRRINRLCQTGKHLANEILNVAAKYGRSSMRVLDIGCGSGDVACEVAARLAGRMSCEVVGWDISQTAVDSATRAWTDGQVKARLSKQKSISVSFERVDVFEPQETQFDVVYCCLFLHHFTEQQATQVLQSMKRIAGLAVLVDDLVRSRWGLALAQVGCQLLSRSPVVHFDGPQSVRAAFTEAEVIGLAKRASMEGCTTRRHWPERYLLRWDA